MPALVHLNAPFGHDLPKRLLRQAARMTLESEGIEGGELSVTFLPDAEIREMNEQWLGHDRVTDVISFALHEDGEAPMGDIYVGVEQAERQAKDHGVPLPEELARLVVHGTLHVLGHDHAGSDSSRMIELQEAIVARLSAGRRAGQGGVGRRDAGQGGVGRPDAGQGGVGRPDAGRRGAGRKRSGPGRGRA